MKNADDMVTRVPSLLGYQHIGCEVNLFAHGKVSLSGVSTDDVREGAVLTDILPKIKGQPVSIKKGSCFSLFRKSVPVFLNMSHDAR